MIKQNFSRSMNLTKLQPSDARYQSQFNHINIDRFQVYTGQALVGKVNEVLVDETENYYLLVEAGSWLSRKQIILPLRQFQIAPAQHRISLPEGSTAISQDSAFMQPAGDVTAGIVSPIELSAPLETSAPLEFPVAQYETTQHDTAARQSDPITSLTPRDDMLNPGAIESASLSAHSSVVDAEIIQLLEERLVIDRQWRKMGEVIVRKVIETRIVEVPVQREKLIVEQISPEHRQLASIELPISADSAVLYPPVNSAMSDRTGLSSAGISNAGVSIEMAHRILEKLQQSPELKQTRVTMQFENTNLQNQYQEWLKEHPLQTTSQATL